LLVLNKVRKIYYLDNSNGLKISEVLAPYFGLYYTDKGDGFALISYSEEYMGDNFHDYLNYQCLYQKLQNYGNAFFREINTGITQR